MSNPITPSDIAIWLAAWVVGNAAGQILACLRPSISWRIADLRRRPEAEESGASRLTYMNLAEAKVTR